MTSFEVASLATGGDPAFGIVKTLTVDFTADGKPHRASGEDPETISLEPGMSVETRCPALLSGRADGRGILFEARQNGQFEIATASGKKFRVAVRDLPQPLPLPGSWQLEFPSESGAGARKLDTLAPWNLDREDAVKYFSGTATYSTELQIPHELLDKGRGLYLDLGRVAVMARVIINGHDLGVLWKAPYRVAIDRFAVPGENTLKINVTNLWINRMIGDESIAEDSDRNGDGTLKAWPKWLLEGKSNPTGRQSFTSWRLWHKGDPLRESGLLGPVILQVTERKVLR